MFIVIENFPNTVIYINSLGINGKKEMRCPFYGDLSILNKVAPRWYYVEIKQN